MKDIFINGRFLSQTRSGTQRFAEEIVLGLDKCLALSANSEFRVTLLTPLDCKRTLSLQCIQTKQVGKLKGHLWEQIDLYVASRRGILVSLINSAPILHSAAVTTFHDASVFEMPELFSRKYRLFHKAIRPLIAKRALRVITVSEFSRKKLALAFKIPESKFTVVSNGCDHIDRHTPNLSLLSDNKLEPQKYVLCVGNATPNKNIHTALRAFQRAQLRNFEFVSVGMPDGRVFNDLVEDETQMKRMRGINDADLRTLYENAALFAFPSKYEGFGIPPLEAMRLGCPVITSRAKALIETVGDAAVLVDPSDVKEFAQQMTRLVEEPEHRNSMIEKGKKRARDFEWQRSSSRVFKILEKLSNGVK